MALDLDNSIYLSCFGSRRERRRSQAQNRKILSPFFVYPGCILRKKHQYMRPLHQCIVRGPAAMVESATMIDFANLNKRLYFYERNNAVRRRSRTSRFGGACVDLLQILPAIL
jgi:hypothetical protein